MRNTLLYSFVFLLVASAKAQSPNTAIDVQHYTFAIQLNDANNSISGQTTIAVKFLKDINSFPIDLIKKNSTGKGMLVSSVIENGKNISFSQSDETLTLSAAAKTNSEHSYTITYSGVPADGLIISTNKFGHRTFFGDNWPNRAHNWLPCVDNPADKAAVDFIVTAPAHYQVIGNGIKTEEETLPKDQKLTHWHEIALLPTKVMVIGAADFAIDQSGDINNIPVYTYVFPENKVEGFKSYAVAAKILPFFINKIGPYAYKKLANVQSKTIFGGMENAGAIFYAENSVGSQGIEELMAHEIAHQWFGDAVSEKSFAHLWLSEGFATFMANYYLENKYGADSLKKRLSAQREKVIGFEKGRLTPVVDTLVKADYMQLLNANSYEKGGWVLHMLRRKLGDDVFWKGIRAYFAKYNGSNANTNDFKNVMAQASGQNLDVFFKQWLFTAGHPQLAISHQYDSAKKTLTLRIDQQQNNLYNVDLEYRIDGKLHTIPISKKITTIQITVQNPTSLVVDPDVNLLASFLIL
ncbi:MAG: M1 family metallopeptidase [Mucilaginibacter sp.]